MRRAQTIDILPLVCLFSRSFPVSNTHSYIPFSFMILSLPVCIIFFLVFLLHRRIAGRLSCRYKFPRKNSKFSAQRHLRRLQFILLLVSFSQNASLRGISSTYLVTQTSQDVHPCLAVSRERNKASQHYQLSIYQLNIIEISYQQDCLQIDRFHSTPIAIAETLNAQCFCVTFYSDLFKLYSNLTRERRVKKKKKQQGDWRFCSLQIGNFVSTSYSDSPMCLSNQKDYVSLIPRTA